MFFHSARELAFGIEKLDADVVAAGYIDAAPWNLRRWMRLAESPGAGPSLPQVR